MTNGILKIKRNDKFITGDLHTHSTYSDGMNSVDQLVVEAKTRGLDAIAITDHLNSKMKGNLKEDYYSKFFSSCKKSAAKNDVIVIPGIEICTLEGHLLALFPYYELSKKVTEIVNDISSEATINQIHEAKGIAVAAHIFRKTGLRENIFPIRTKIDGLELCSYNNVKRFNVANKLEVAEVSGSDAHSRIGIGATITLFPQNSSSYNKNLENIFGCIKTRKTKAYPISSYGLLRNLDKTRWLSPFYATKNLLSSINDENNVLYEGMKRLIR
ncbi:MAG: PHP domain-containing protein [Candidatus Bathyarchaeota archaeon]|nr:MAG: PHP domain-containing protein [Candidatus Bathyarchaeota archaeon]